MVESEHLAMILDKNNPNQTGYVLFRKLEGVGLD